jgi:transglutaminase-like putative cysteine protease
MRLMPLSLPDRQRLVAGSIKVSPTPDEQSNFVDFFEHPATSFMVRAPHEKLDIRMQARVQVESHSISADFSPVACRSAGRDRRRLVAEAAIAAPLPRQQPAPDETPVISDYAKGS